MVAFPRVVGPTGYPKRSTLNETTLEGARSLVWITLDEQIAIIYTKYIRLSTKKKSMKFTKNTPTKKLRIDLFDSNKKLVFSFPAVSDPSKSDDFAGPNMKASKAADALGIVSKFRTVTTIN